jgi:two-component system, chemotaxis family, CheB/CheR fusion protein
MDVGKKETRARRGTNSKTSQASSVSRKTSASQPPENSRNPFYIVGMGASAGGLEALERFFSRMPSDSGLALVIVSHLDPTQKGMMPEILQRFTEMKVYPVEDGMKVEPNRVYVIPSNKDLSILHGTLHLLEPTASRGLRLPIDFFFRHLAEDQKERSIGIILSGMGTDGTSGVRAIKEKLGMVMVQDIKSARSDGMPRGAIDTGLVDYIAPAEELPAKLIAYVTHASIAPKKAPTLTAKASSLLHKVFILLRDQTGHDFSLYKKNTISRRIERRMNVHQIDSMSMYVRYLQQNPQELELLFRELLIGVTNFFRDPEAFEVLKQEVLEHLLKDRRPGHPLRVWVPGCSTGEEAHSLGILLTECLDELKCKGSFKIQIFGTDLDKEAIEHARQGLYPANIAANLSQERLERFFTRDESGGYRISKDIREQVVFAPQNVLSDPPFTKLDILSCRNLLIYLAPESQNKLLRLFHYSLNPGGILFLGSAETIGRLSDHFAVLHNKWKVYRRTESAAASAGVVDFPSELSPRALDSIPDPLKLGKGVGASVQENVESVLLENYAPSAVLINENGDVLYIHGRTGKYLELAAGRVNINIYALTREALRYELGRAIRKAVTQQADVTVKDLRLSDEGGDRTVLLTVKLLTEPETMRGLLLVVFQDVSTPPQAKRSGKKGAGSAPAGSVIVSELEKDLRQAREDLQSTVEEMEASREELKSANEELQSTNEELQSTNEELTTSKEEMQSLNEELMTINAELQHKIDQLTRSDSDMKNLLNSTNIATLFVDNHLNVKRFTASVTGIFKLIPSDVGRPIEDIASNLKYEDLVKDVKETLDTLVYKEMQVQSKDKRCHLMRIMPYRTLDNVIDGAVITFTDITILKEMEDSLEESRRFLQDSYNYAESILATIREPLLVLDAEMRIVSANQSFYRTFQTTPEETRNEILYNLGNGQWKIPALRQLLEEVVPANKVFVDFFVEHEFPRIGRKKMLLNGRQIQQEGSEKHLILLAIEDVTERT